MLQNRFKFNLRFKTLGEVFSRICALALYAIGARLMGTDGFGLFSLAFSYAMLASVIVDSGTVSIITRMIARDKSQAPALVRTATTYKFLVAPVAVLAIYVMVRFLDPSGQTAALVRVTGMVAIATAFLEHIQAVLSGYERMDIEAWVKSSSKIASVAFAVIAFQFDPTVRGFTAGMAIGLWISVLGGLWWIHRNLGAFRPVIDRALLRRLLRTGLPVFLAWVLVTFYTNQDRYLMSYMRFSEHDIGIYSAALKLIDAMRPMAVLLMGAVYPIMAEAAVKDRPLFEKIAGALVKYGALVLFPFAFGVTVFADEIIRIVFGPEFRETAPVLQISIWGFFGVFLNHMFFSFQLSSDRQRRFFECAALLFFVNAVLCLILLRTHGIVGGAWAFVGGEMAVLAFNLLDPQNAFLRKRFAARALRPLFMAAVSIAVFFIARVWLPQELAWVLGVGVFAALVWRASMIDLPLLKRFIV